MLPPPGGFLPSSRSPSWASSPQQAQSPSPTSLSYPTPSFAWGKGSLPQGREMRSQDAAELSNSHCRFFFADAYLQSHLHYLNLFCGSGSFQPPPWKFPDFPQALAPLASQKDWGCSSCPFYGKVKSECSIPCRAPSVAPHHP